MKITNVRKKIDKSQRGCYGLIEGKKKGAPNQGPFYKPPSSST
jgi:hypothetical protein